MKSLQWSRNLQLQIRDLQRQVAELKVRDAKAGVDSILSRTREISGVKVLAHQLAETDRASMRALADELKQKLGSGVVVLGTPQNGKVALVVMVTADIASRVPAGRIIKEIAAIVGGAGGGKPNWRKPGERTPPSFPTRCRRVT